MKRMALAVGALLLMSAFNVFTSQDASAAQYGKASYYWQPQPLASGGRFNPNAMSAAHKTLPFGTKVRVTRTSTGRSVVVIINDRGPYIAGRIIDLSRAAAQRLGMTGAGVTAVRVDIIGKGSVRNLALGGGGGKYGGNVKSTTYKTAAKNSRKSGKSRKAKKSSNRKFAGLPKSLRGKKIISVKRRYSVGGKTRTTSGRIPKGATLLMEEIVYTN